MGICKKRKYILLLSYDPVYTGITDFFPAWDITDIVETPRWVYTLSGNRMEAIWTAVSCKIYYVPKNTISAGGTSVESLNIWSYTRINRADDIHP